MWISEIKIKNFRPFYKEHTITFDESSQNKFTIIEAQSDTGKTALLSAICWCLYGKDLGDVHEKNMHPFNIARKEELNDKGYDELSVEITLNSEGETSPHYVIKREYTCVREGNKMIYASDVELKVEEWEDNECRPIKDPIQCQKTIDTILPQDIHMFFLFEGEKLEKHF